MLHCFTWVHDVPYVSMLYKPSIPVCSTSSAACVSLAVAQYASSTSDSLILCCLCMAFEQRSTRGFASVEAIVD
jgi:hypothetical protein